QIAVTAGLEANGGLAQASHGFEAIGQQARLIVITRAAHMVIDLLQANQIGILLLDHVDDPFEVVAPVAPADSLMNVVAQKPHRPGIYSLFDRSPVPTGRDPFPKAYFRKRSIAAAPRRLLSTASTVSLDL